MDWACFVREEEGESLFSFSFFWVLFFTPLSLFFFFGLMGVGVCVCVCTSLCGRPHARTPLPHDDYDPYELTHDPHHGMIPASMFRRSNSSSSSSFYGYREISGIKQISLYNFFKACPSPLSVLIYLLEYEVYIIWGGGWFPTTQPNCYMVTITDSGRGRKCVRFPGLINITIFLIARSYRGK